MALVEAMRLQSQTRKPLRRFGFAGKRKNEDGTWETLTFPDVVLAKIKSFGFVHDLETTKKGTPREYIRWGYILLNSGAYYRVAILTVRELQDRLGTRCRIDRKETLTATLSTGKIITAYDWHMSIVAPIKPN